MNILWCTFNVTIGICWLTLMDTTCHLALLAVLIGDNSRHSIPKTLARAITTLSQIKVSGKERQVLSGKRLKYPTAFGQTARCRVLLLMKHNVRMSLTLWQTSNDVTGRESNTEQFSSGLEKHLRVFENSFKGFF